MTKLQETPGAILFIDEIHTIIGAGATSGGAMDASNLLKPALQSGKLRCMGSTTYKEYRQHFEKDRALSRRFLKVDVSEPSSEDAVKILMGLKSYFEEFHKVKYTDEAIEGAVTLAVRHVTDRKLPDKAIDVIDEAGARQRLLPEDKRKKTVTIKEIEEVIAKIARIPPKSIRGMMRKLSRASKATLSGWSLVKIRPLSRSRLRSNLPARVFVNRISQLARIFSRVRRVSVKPRWPSTCYDTRPGTSAV